MAVSSSEAAVGAWWVPTLVSRAGVALGLFGAPAIGLPAVDMPGFLARAFGGGPVAVALAWLVFVVPVGALWVWVFRELTRTLPRSVAAAATVGLNWVVCTCGVLPAAVLWGPRVAAGVVPAPGWFGLHWSAGVPWTLLLAFALSAPGLILAGGPAE